MANIIEYEIIQMAETTPKSRIDPVRQSTHIHLYILGYDVLLQYGLTVWSL